MKIILGSGSKWRQQMLQKMGYDFEVMTADVDEKTIRCDDFYELPVKLACAKADAIMGKLKAPVILITADQVVLCNGELREKPASEKECRRYLRSYGQFPAEIVNAVVVTNTQNGKRVQGIDIAKVYSNPMPNQLIEQMIKLKDIINAAGGFLVNHELIKPYIKKYEGAEGNELALPGALTERLMREAQE